MEHISRRNTTSEELLSILVSMEFLIFFSRKRMISVYCHKKQHGCMSLQKRRRSRSKSTRKGTRKANSTQFILTRCLLSLQPQRCCSLQREPQQLTKKPHRLTWLRMWCRVWSKAHRRNRKAFGDHGRPGTGPNRAEAGSGNSLV